VRVRRIVAGVDHQAVPVEPVTREAPRTPRRTLLTQQWRDLTFLHWPVAPEKVAPLLPPGVTPDLHDGVSWVGLVAFRMWRIGLLRTPGLPYLGTFPETNVRLYAVDAQGRRGVVFRSLEATRLAPVLVARAVFRLPYMWSSMSIVRTGDEIGYVSRRRWPRAQGRPRSRITVRIGAPIAEPSPLEDFLTARWGLSNAWFGATRYLPNVHPAWSLHEAELLDLDDDLVAAAGLPAPHGPPASVLYSPGVPVWFGEPA
jgi:uncharacterized protein YqjF (DUF2071 family)